jgi:hypothetical protein
MEGRSGITISLFHDNNIDGHADNQIPFATQLSDSLGYFSFDNIPVGNYVLAETQLLDFLSIKDIDASDDEDLVENTDIHNDTIPVTLIMMNMMTRIISSTAFYILCSFLIQMIRVWIVARRSFLRGRFRHYSIRHLSCRNDNYNRY